MIGGMGEYVSNMPQQIGHLGMAASISAMRRMVSLKAVTTL
jgi:hypothetical protein